MKNHENENSQNNGLISDLLIYPNMTEIPNNSSYNSCCNYLLVTNYMESMKENIEDNNIFNINNNFINSSNGLDNNYLIKKRNRGRKKNNKFIFNTNSYIHDKFRTDNLLRKVQNHYLNFIVSFLNEILQNLGFNEKLYFLNYQFKLNITKKNLYILSRENIGNILCNEISPKYLTKNKNINLIIIEKIKDNPVIKSILSENYLKLFKDIYYRSNRIINLKYYGLNKVIILSKKIKMYQDLLKISNNNSIKSDNYYIQRMNECVTRNFLGNSIFVCN